MFAWLSAHVAEVLIALGLALIAFEVVVIGFATFVLLFIGLSLVISGLLIFAGYMPVDLSTILLSNAIITTVLGLALWKPLKRIQNHSDQRQVQSDFDGLEIVLEQAIDRQQGQPFKHSGVTWQLKSEQAIAAGTTVKVVRAEVGVFWVEAA